MFFRLLGCAILLASLLAAPDVRAQEGVRPAAEPAEAGEIEITLERFGVGGLVRPGDWAGVRLALLDRGTAVRPVIVQMALTDSDGDTALWQRSATLNPGRPQGVWLYARLPYELRAASAIRVSVHEPRAEGAGAGEPAGRELSSAVISPQAVIEATSPMIGIIGRASAGLDRYRVAAPGGAPTDPATGHEWIEFALIDPDQLGGALPDAWMGLSAIKTIVWTEGDPGRLRSGAAQALKAWVQRGGHLVIVLPQDALGWESASKGPLGELMPEARIVRRENVDLERYRPLLRAPGGPAMPSGLIVHSFEREAGAKESEATTILQGPGGEAVATRRLVGAGAVTVVGIDVADREVASRLDPQRFWHRVLGERFDVLSQAEMSGLEQATPPANFRSRTPVWVDDAVGTFINKTGRAGAGVLLGFGVFAAYWIVAGPGGFAVLRWTGWAKHSWLVFVGVAAVFTAIAWGGATALRPAKVEATHLTFYDHVYGEELVRARSWIGALLPRYGTTRVGIERKPGRRPALTAWETPGTTGDRFPDPRSYAINSLRPDDLALPSRATAKQLRADWLGAPAFTSIVPTEPIALSEGGSLTGVIEHRLPSAMEGVTIMLVLRQTALRDPAPGGLQARTLAWRLDGAWAPERALDLSALSAGRSASATTGEAYLDRLARTARRWAELFGVRDRDMAAAKLEAITWGPMLGPPDYQQMASATGFPAIVNRRLGHGLDLSRWFTQPCLIVVGRAETEIPAPLRVDGERPPSSGQTVVRWVYPLPANPPAAVEASP